MYRLMQLEEIKKSTTLKKVTKNYTERMSFVQGGSKVKCHKIINQIKSNVNLCVYLFNLTTKYKSYLPKKKNQLLPIADR